jgi:hypothetical protein
VAGWGFFVIPSSSFRGLLPTTRNLGAAARRGAAPTTEKKAAAPD